ncbi:MAG: ROK family protein [Planctomycetota bacterium]
MPSLPVLDPSFQPAVVWNRAYRARVAADPGARDVRLALERPDGTVFVHDTRVLGPGPENAAWNERHAERLVKSLLWIRGGSRIHVAGAEDLARALAAAYSAAGVRAFDHETVGVRMFGEGLSVRACRRAEVPPANARSVALGRHLDGCRIGFDLGGSDRKCAALIDGEVVHSEEVAWDPYFQSDPRYHYDGIHDSLRRAAAHLPRVDAIGGSAAGVYVNNEPRVASLFRGVSPADFARHVRPIFHRLKEAWGGVPFEVVNDGEVTALAGAMATDDNALLGISMGTSLAAGYCDPEGHITAGLNELAFVPVDYRPDAPADEWSGDLGCGVQYFSQQAVARLAPRAGLDFPAAVPLAERLVAVQERLATGDERARRIYETIGTYLGYSVAHWAEFYSLRHVLVLGRVTSGPGGEVILATAGKLLRAEFSDLAARVALRTPGEKEKRLGQAIAAASLPAIDTDP